MPKVKIGDTTYDTESLSKEALSRLQMVRTCEQKLQDLKREQAIVQTARQAFLSALRPLLPK